MWSARTTLPWLRARPQYSVTYQGRPLARADCPARSPRLAGYHIPAACVGRELAQESILITATNDSDCVDLAPGQLLQCVCGPAIFTYQTFQAAAHHCRWPLRCAPASPSACSSIVSAVSTDSLHASTSTSPTTCCRYCSAYSRIYFSPTDAPTRMYGSGIPAFTSNTRSSAAIAAGVRCTRLASLQPIPAWSYMQTRPAYASAGCMRCHSSDDPPSPVTSMTVGL